MLSITQILGLSIVRGDMVSGGIKRSALNFLLRRISSSSIFYAGTTKGHGALALAHASQDSGKQAHIFISGTDDDPMIQKLWATNAILHLCAPVPITTLYDMANKSSGGAPVFPPGFDMPEFESALAESLSGVDVAPYSEIWVVSVTGTLTRALKRAFPDKKFKTVSVVKNGPPCDFTAPEKYHQPAKSPPPYPSCPYTDAKIWQFAQTHAAPDALIWNTAG